MRATGKAVVKNVRRVELLLWTVGVLCAGYLSFAALQAHDARTASVVLAAGLSGRAEAVASSEASRVIGRLSIPQIALSVPVMSDFETDSLLKGVGHIQGTAMPGGLGTMGLAGHRDTYFRPLRDIKLGMGIDVSDETGTYHYRVDSTEVVMPEQVQVLNIRDRPEMTLITCYPFNYVGAAPKRFIVHAHLLSASPDVAKRESN